jgi:hypothetical protein
VRRFTPISFKAVQRKIAQHLYAHGRLAHLIFAKSITNAATWPDYGIMSCLCCLIILSSVVAVS